MTSSILLTGATGQLGRHLKQSGLFSPLLTPPRHHLDLLNDDSIEKYFNRHRIHAVIHTAALARMRDCEEQLALAVDTNIIGTARLVNAVLGAEKKYRRSIRFIYISTDGVYASTVGNYKETDNPLPYNHYGLTKLGGEKAVKHLRNYCIIRTRFYDPHDLPFIHVASDAYSSSISLDACAKAIYQLLYHPFVGIINVGDRRQSDYQRFKQIKPSIKPCTLASIQHGLPFRLSKDASMNTTLWRSLRG